MKILFFLINMNLGGTEKSFLNLLESLPKDDEVTLLLLDESGDLLSELPPHVNLKIIHNSVETNSIIKNGFNVLFLQYLKRYKILKSLQALTYYFLAKIDKKNDYYYRFSKNQLKKLEGNYDYAVAFAGPHSFISNFIIDRVIAKNKIQWIHFDVSKIGFDFKSSERIYSKFQKIICVSEDVKNEFLKVLPQLKNKTKVKYNIIPYAKIEELSKEKIDNFEKDVVAIVTVGRLTKEKGHEQFLTAMKRLKDEGQKFCWYIIGDGDQKNKLEEFVSELDLNDFVKFLGKKSNPYPYYKSCDIYLQPSYYEGHCVSILEAKYFRKPIICTNFAGAREEVDHNVNGIIVDFKEDLFYSSLHTLITNKDLRQKFGYVNATKTFQTEVMNFERYLNN